MTVCPLDYRYGSGELRDIFSEEGKLRRMLEVEAALARVQERYGMIPAGTGHAVSEAVSGGAVSVERVREIESEIRHDVMSVVKGLAEQAGEAGQFVHYGATSNDIIDTATALQLRDSIAFLKEGVAAAGMALAKLAKNHRDTPMLGRTHGQWAIPMTFGLKMAVYAAEMYRHMERLYELTPRVCAGKMLGAVGSGAAMGKNALEIHQEVMDELGLSAEMAPSQLVGRDRYVEMVCWCASVSASLEKFATEVRNLQRPEIGEVSEHFDLERQVGSSTMAQKRNPITSENICGLARVVRGFVTPSFENVVSWHERDLCNSSAERFTLSHTIILTHDILVKTAGLFDNLHVHKERMLENLKHGGAEIMAESVMMALTEKGMGRQDAHGLVRDITMLARKEGVSIQEAFASSDIGKILGDELDTVLDPRRYLGSSGKIVDEVVSLYE